MFVAGTETMDRRSKMSQGCNGHHASCPRRICRTPLGTLCPALEDQGGTGPQVLAASSGLDHYLDLYHN